MGHRKGTALFSGAASPEARRLAHCFAESGYDIVLLDRQPAHLKYWTRELQQRHGVRVSVMQCDLRDRHSLSRTAFLLEESGSPVTALVNLTEAPEYGAFADTLIDEDLSFIRNTVFGTAMLTKCVLSSLIRNKGRILISIPLLPRTAQASGAVNSACRAFRVSFYRSLREELRSSGVQVSLLCSGESELEDSMNEAFVQFMAGTEVIYPSGLAERQAPRCV